MRWLLLLVGIGCLAWSLSMAPGLSERDAQYRLDLARGSGASEAQVARLAGEANAAAGRGMLNIVGWGSLIGFAALSWPRKRKQQATPPAQP